MTSERERWDRVQELFLEALELDADHRERFLRERCSDDEPMRREVAEMLEAVGEADDYFAGLASRAGALSAPQPATTGTFADLSGARVGAYRLLRPIGQGGMGDVYLAARADGQFRMQAAVKLLPPVPGSAAMYERFLLERQILAGLDHPGIARLLDGGVTDAGVPYFVMEYVEGEPIHRYSAGRRLDLRARLELFRQVCEAVQYAHDASVVHRDLKPSNILVTEEGSTKLLDFGIAKVLEGDPGAESTLTRWGGSPLTPAYASPEQVSGEAVGFASDVYQLGVLLYHLLTGRAPYPPLAGLPPAEVRRTILEHEPAAPSEVLAEAAAAAGGQAAGEMDACRVREVDAVVLKALRKQPEQRYPSAAVLAEDVTRWLEGRSVTAPRERRFRIGRTLRRRPRAAAAAMSVLLAIVLATLLPAGAWRGLADRTEWLAPFRASGPEPVPVSASTGSLVAYRFYEEGLRAYYRGQPSVAHLLFGAAVQEDSAFAMATYYLARSAPDAAQRYARLERAKRLAQRATERERLLITAEWANLMSDPGLRAVADTLVSRYPAELDGYYLLGVAYKREGEFLAALPYFERAVVLDSSGFTGGVLCRGCDALDAMVTAYVLADSLPAAERTARRWIDLQPGSALARERLAWTLWRQDRGEEALAARLEAAQRRSATAHDMVYPAVVAVRMGNHVRADALLAERLRDGTPQVRREALWWQTLSFRYQGRLSEALASARRYRALREAGADPYTWRGIVPEAQVLFELGRYAESARLLETAAAQPFAGFSTARHARQRLWLLTHAATAAMAAGDTARVREMADTVEALGRLSGFARDRRLHHYPRGLLLAELGEHRAAAEAFRRAIYSPSGDFVRPKLELARQLIVLGEPEEAVRVLQAALRGPLAGGGYYATQPELQLLLARAWAAAGRPDSAAVYFARAAAARERADPGF